MALTSDPTRPFGAVLTAMVTPMTPDGAVDLEAARTLATWLVDHGCDGLVLNGTTGEAPTTHAPEKADLVAAVVDAVGDRAVVLAGAGSNDTAHAARMAEQATEAGADGLLVVSPYYSRPSQEGLARHLEAVTEAGGRPVMLYDVPGRTGVRISAGVYARLAQHPLVVATKDATGDVAAAAGLAADTGLAWYSGDDALLLPFLAHGGAGLVSVAAHAVPAAFAETVAAWDAGDTARALAAFRTALPAIAALNGAGFQAVMAKAAAEALGVIGGRTVRLPLVEASDDEAAAVRAGLVAAGVLATR
ncbi:dihydrodipicolinate synthase [Xylanimonas cellulosilytica DSM 15894]|uniref:4-hydroxy-tetrahydrodipicolinate synthase n=1 Tax=Xylanimonas cellulosilytica (strain DSM 15894 / JCM 12276 / CECT 5975 / KCTC 9989 / LMG 20990 / NBRC 107835 / XIL07) TaxID=446471 RepID=D1C071_XYLCX|nr:4-hydroxy-tetrahydrodipicolinate synthase [Xylanimonas cellulosilytica]ACZ30260.1 dihydrodipicolinate synthase [Xylanimonas cellulosilytica DSM 15894]